jgi:hypothetical protein
MPTRGQVCTWIAAVGVLAPSIAARQDRTEREVVDLIVRDGPPAQIIRAEVEITRREQQARLAYPNPSVTYSTALSMIVVPILYDRFGRPSSRSVERSL